MKVTIDTDARVLVAEDVADDLVAGSHDLDSPEAFAILSRAWVTTGWSQRYTYGFTWMGRPIIQLPEDMVVFQEVVHRVQPDVIIETGVAHGGSLVYSASLCAAMGKGRVVGIDIEIRPHNRTAIEEHRLAPMITLVEGSSTAPETVAAVRALVGDDEVALVVLDSNHSRQHVLDELDAYAPFVPVGSYLVATDGVMEWLPGVPGVPDSWADDNPAAAAREWIGRHPEFVIEDPPPIAFNEGTITERVTHWPCAYLRRVA